MTISQGDKCNVCGRKLSIMNVGPDYEQKLCACCYARIKCSQEDVGKGAKYDRRRSRSPFDQKTLHEIYVQGVSDGIKMYSYKKDGEDWVGHGSVAKRLNEALIELEESVKK